MTTMIFSLQDCVSSFSQKLSEKLQVRREGKLGERWGHGRETERGERECESVGLQMQPDAEREGMMLGMSSSYGHRYKGGQVLR
eukprot:756109-Hanusia_phi.AAC.1